MSTRTGPAAWCVGLTAFAAIAEPRLPRPKTKAIERPITPIPRVHLVHPIAVTFDLLLLAGDQVSPPEPHGSSSSPWLPRPWARFLPERSGRRRLHIL